MSTQDCVLGYSQPSLRDCFVAERNRNWTRAPGLPQRSPEFLPSLLAFLTESRTAKPVWCRVQEIRVALICGSF